MDAGAVAASVLDKGWFWGPVIGAALAFVVQRLLHRSQRRGERQMVAMLAATHFRSWLSDCLRSVEDHRNWTRSDGQFGRMLVRLPELQIEHSLEQVARLKPDDARAIFELIHEKRSADESAASFADVEGPEEAADWLCDECASIFLHALPIYERLAKAVGWNSRAFAVERVETMKLMIEERRKREAALVEERRKRRIRKASDSDIPSDD